MYTVHASNNRCSGKFVFAIENKFTVFTTIDSEWDFFALFLCNVKGNRVDDDNRLALLMSISDCLSGSAGASIPYCKNIIGVIYHVPISVFHTVRRVLPLQHGLLVALCRNIIIPFPCCHRPFDRLCLTRNVSVKPPRV